MRFAHVDAALRQDVETVLSSSCEIRGKSNGTTNGFANELFLLFIIIVCLGIAKNAVCVCIVRTWSWCRYR